MNKIPFFQKKIRVKDEDSIVKTTYHNNKKSGRSLTREINLV